jgi:hypothetical protein
VQSTVDTNPEVDVSYGVTEGKEDRDQIEGKLVEIPSPVFVFIFSYFNKVSGMYCIFNMYLTTSCPRA